MYKALHQTHLISVVLFLLIYLIKTIFLLINKNEGLAKFTKIVKIPEMIISLLFFCTGIYMLTQIPEIKSLMIIKIVTVVFSIPIAIIGFKKKIKVLAVLSLLMIIGAYGMAEMSKKQRPKALRGFSESNVNGKEIYNAACIECHGADGNKEIMGADNLNVSTMDFSLRIETIKNGAGEMNGFKGILTDEQINAAAVYSETLKK